MSNFACGKCGAICSDTPRGYVTGCDHYPPDWKALVYELTALREQNATLSEQNAALSESHARLLKDLDVIARYERSLGIDLQHAAVLSVAETAIENEAIEQAQALEGK